MIIRGRDTEMGSENECQISLHNAISLKIYLLLILLIVGLPSCNIFKADSDNNEEKIIDGIEVVEELPTDEPVWHINPADPNIVTFPYKDGEHLQVFGTKDENGNIQHIDGFRLFDLTTEENGDLVLLNEDGLPNSIVMRTGEKLHFEYDEAGMVLMKFETQDSTVLHSLFRLSDIDEDQVSSTKKKSTNTIENINPEILLTVNDRFDRPLNGVTTTSGVLVGGAPTNYNIIYSRVSDGTYSARLPFEPHPNWTEEMLELRGKCNRFNQDIDAICTEVDAQKNLVPLALAACLSFGPFAGACQAAVLTVPAICLARSAEQLIDCVAVKKAIDIFYSKHERIELLTKVSIPVNCSQIIDKTFAPPIVPPMRLNAKLDCYPPEFQLLIAEVQNKESIEIEPQGNEINIRYQIVANLPIDEFKATVLKPNGSIYLNCPDIVLDDNSSLLTNSCFISIPQEAEVGSYNLNLEIGSNRDDPSTPNLIRQLSAFTTTKSPPTIDDAFISYHAEAACDTSIWDISYDVVTEWSDPNGLGEGSTLLATWAANGDSDTWEIEAQSIVTSDKIEFGVCDISGANRQWKIQIRDEAGFLSNTANVSSAKTKLPISSNKTTKPQVIVTNF